MMLDGLQTLLLASADLPTVGTSVIGTGSVVGLAWYLDVKAVRKKVEMLESHVSPVIGLPDRVSSLEADRGKIVTKISVTETKLAALESDVSKLGSRLEKVSDATNETRALAQRLVEGLL